MEQAESHHQENTVLPASALRAGSSTQGVVLSPTSCCPVPVFSPSSGQGRGVTGPGRRGWAWTGNGQLQEVTLLSMWRVQAWEACSHGMSATEKMDLLSQRVPKALLKCV